MLRHIDDIGTRAGFAVGRLTLSVTIIMAIVSTGCSSKHSTGDNGKEHGFAYYPAWSADGGSIAYMLESIDPVTDLPESRLCILDISTGITDTIWLASPMLVYDLDWSPDGGWIVFASTSGIHKISRVGDSLSLLATSGFSRSPCWVESQNQILYVVVTSPDGGIYAVGSDGHSPHRKASSALALISIDCSLQNDSVAAVQVGVDYSLVVLAPSDTSRIDTLLSGLTYADHVTISSDGAHLYFFGRPLETDPLGLYSVDRATAITHYLSDGYTYDISPDGSSLVYSDAANTKRLRVIDLSTGHDTLLIQD